MYCLQIARVAWHAKLTDPPACLAFCADDFGDGERGSVTAGCWPRRRGVGGNMEVRLLGPVEIYADGSVVEVGPPQRRVVVAALAVDAGRVVTLRTLIDRVWDDPPPGARQALHAHMARIRQMLARAGPEVRLARRSAGYVLEIGAQWVDMLHFRDLLRRAAEPGISDEAQESLLDVALDLWQGEPLRCVDGQWAAQVREVLHRERLDASVAWARAMLRIGAVERVVARIHPLTLEYRTAEHLAATLLRALHAARRDAEALHWYDAFRRRLANTLGADPGLELREIHSVILGRKL
jgi:DNA-binding SARP family transcriptional activator